PRNAIWAPGTVYLLPGNGYTAIGSAPTAGCGAAAHGTAAIPMAAAAAKMYLWNRCCTVANGARTTCAPFSRPPRRQHRDDARRGSLLLKSANLLLNTRWHAGLRLCTQARDCARRF